MDNNERSKEIIMNYENVTFIEYQEKKKEILNSLRRDSDMCHKVNCISCLEILEPLEAIKTVMDYEIPIDWTKIEVDTPILVKGLGEGKWFKRYFSRYENEKIYAWKNGATSWSAEDECATFWRYAKLYEKEDNGEQKNGKGDNYKL